MLIETERLKIYTATREQMEAFAAAETNEELKKAYTEMLEGCLKHPDQWEWYVMWRIELRNGTNIGDLCFKGLDANGVAEIGYGILEEHQGHGYATEAVNAAVVWALKQPTVTRVEAETEPDNLASQRVLEKCGFLPAGVVGEEGPRFFRTLDRQVGVAEERMRLRLVRPSLKYAGQVMNFRSDMLANHDSLDGCAGLEEVSSFAEWMDFEGRLKRKYNDGYTPSEVFLDVRSEDDKLVGIIDYRHPLTPFLLQYGGNIGYSVLPSERRKGYAGELLNLMLDVCREHEEEKVLICCNKNNDASRRTILKNGGRLESEITDDIGTGECGIIQRYWIDL